MRVTIVPEDRTVIVGGVAATLGVTGGTPMPAVDPDWHAVQFYDDGHAVIEAKRGAPVHLEGVDAAKLVSSFVAAHGAEIERLATPPAPTKASRIAETKAEAQWRIVPLAPTWRQVNMLARAVELNRNRVVNGALTADERAEETSLLDVWAKVKAIRAASDDLEASIAGMADADVAALDVTAWVGWP